MKVGSGDGRLVSGSAPDEPSGQLRRDSIASPLILYLVNYLIGQRSEKEEKNRSMVSALVTLEPVKQVIQSPAGSGSRPATPDKAPCLPASQCPHCTEIYTVQCVDLGESFQTHIYFQIWLPYSRERAL